MARVDVTYLNIYYLIKQMKFAAVYYLISNALAMCTRICALVPWYEPRFFGLRRAKNADKILKHNLLKHYISWNNMYELHRVVHQKLEYFLHC